MLFFFGFLFACALIFSGVSAFIFWRTATTEHITLLCKASGNRLWLWAVVGIFSRTFSQIWAYFLFPLTLFPRLWLTPPAHSGRKGPPVLFVHGYVHIASVWLHFACFFKKAGYTDLHAYSYNTYKLTFEQCVERLEEELTALTQARTGQKIVLVGHSLGGLLIRAVLNRNTALSESLLAVVTLGTPHQGSSLGRVAPTPVGKSLAYKGRVVTELWENHVIPPCPCLSLYSLLDDLVLPLEGCRINLPGWQEKQTGPVCHIGLLYAPSVIKTTLTFIADVQKQQALTHKA